MTKLETCVWCGVEGATIYDQLADENAAFEAYRMVTCSVGLGGCGMVGPSGGRDRDLAGEKWNRLQERIKMGDDMASMLAHKGKLVVAERVQGQTPFTCPRCVGTGYIDRVPYGEREWERRHESYLCETCQGSGVLWGSVA